MNTTTGYLSFNKAVDLMHRKDGRLCRMHVAAGKIEWFVLPRGGRVKPGDVEKILAMPDIIASGDGLFPGLDQTWRMVR